MATDLMVFEKPVVAGEDPYVQLTRLMLEISELALDNDLINVIGRAAQLWLRIPEETTVKNRRSYVSFASEFRVAYDVDLDIFLRVLYFLLARSASEDVQGQAPWAKYVIDTQTYFLTTVHSPETAQKVLQILACPLMDMRKELEDRAVQRHGHKIAALERFPFFQVDEHYFIFYDRNLLLRFFTHGIWWRILDKSPPDKQEHFRAYFGDVFEIYVKRVLAHACDQSKQMRLHDSLRFNSTQEICDSLIETEDAWIVMEVKASLLMHKSKYSGDGTQLKQDILSRFSGTEEKPKGARQLGRSINRLLKGEQDTMKRLDISGQQNIYPVLISYDTTICNKFIAKMLDAEMRKDLTDIQPTSPVVMPLTILSSEDIEAVSALGYKHLMQSLIDSYQKSTASLPSFAAQILNKHRQDANVELAYTHLNFKQFHDTALKDLKP